ncbi:hypothetical protein Hrd1104_11430 [Halorhabdus sp. CBA1104]|uniref:hypothetical protein n=1 Tax=Halorhabdus sp. CBA1104 TaxID=1380432 RepID=UPI0012B2E356|nr:hypothetical protein [Halorhabdus sp. CBA1104]QGN07852.1 hypothetical protein Hrd1104_11430 [Halorhabdus sp. CBA1104]
MGVLFAGEVQWLVGNLSSNGIVLISFGLDALVEWINTQIFNAVFTLIGYLLNGSMQTLLHLNPTALKQFQDMWELSVGIYFALLTVFALAHLGMFQFFPDGKKSDPYRFAGRALAATLSLFIVNPPGWGPTLWGRGLFAAAFEVSNATIDLFLESTTFTVSASPDTGGAGSFVLLLFGVVMGLIVTVGQLLLVVVLVARKVIVYLTYGLYPLLIVFWIGELGPLKYAKAVGEKLFKATGMLIPGGILIAGVFAVGLKFAHGSLAMLAGGSVESGGVDAAFASGSSVHPLLAAAMPLMAVTAMNLVAITYVVKWLSGAMGGAASKMTGKAKSAMKGGASKASSAVSGGVGGGMVGGMAGGDRTAVNNQFAGGPAPAAASAAGGGGRDERDSQTVNDTAPELEQTPMSALDNERLAEGDSESGHQEYGSPESDGEALGSESITEADSGPTESVDTIDRASESPSGLERPKASDIHFEEIEREEMGEAMTKMDDEERGKLLYDVMNKSRTVDQAQGDDGNKYLRGIGGDAVKGVVGTGVGIAAAGGAAPMVAAGAVAGAAVLGASQGIAGTGVESLTTKIGQGKDLKNSLTSEISDLKSELKDWTEKGSVKTAEWRTGDGESAGGSGVDHSDNRFS